MKTNICPYSCQCRLFNNRLLNNNSEEIYKNLYCLTPKGKECKRYHVFERIGECPDFLMPNSEHDLDIVIKGYREEKKMFEKLKADY